MSGFPKSLFFPLLVFPMLAFSFAAQSAEMGSHYVLCKLGIEVRTLRIEPGEAGKCVATYNKAGKDQSIGLMQNVASCEVVLTRVRGNLEKANWKCRDVKDSTVSTLSSDVQ